MADFFAAIFTMSLTATLTAAVVMLLRPLLKRLGAPKTVVFLLWAVVLFRMVCPLSFESPVSVMGLLPQRESSTTADFERNLEMFEKHPSISSYYPIDGEPQTRPDFSDATPYQALAPNYAWLNPLSILWAAGALSVCALSLLSYLRLKNKVRAAVKSEDGAWETDQIDAPFVLGFLPAKIYLPLGLDGEARRYVLLHERAHIRRGDHLVKAIAFLSLALHWFNPLLWLAWILACRDMEAACDESVLRGSGADIRQAYSSALLSLAGVRPIRVPLAFGENDVKNRIKGVLDYRKPLLAVMALAIVGVLTVGLVLAANPMPLPEEPGTLTVQRNPHSNDTMTASTRDDGPLSYNFTGSVEFWLSGETPDELTVTERIITGGSYSQPHTVYVSPFAGIGGHYGIRLGYHPASSGTGTEERLFEVRTRWTSGVNHLDAVYYFRLLVPARGPDETLPAPVAFAGGQVLPLFEGDDFSALPASSALTVLPGSYLEVAHPGGVAATSLDLYALPSGEHISGSSTVPKDDPSDNPNTTLSFGGSGSRLPDTPGPIGVLLTYTYPDGTQTFWRALLNITT